MPFTERLVLWFHIAFVIFTIGPVTITIMSSLRAIRTRNLVVLRYLLLMTRIFSAASLGVLIFGLVLAQQQKDLGEAWLAVAITLYVVAVVLLVLIMRDQRRAIAALESTGEREAPAPDQPEGGRPAGADADAAGSPRPAAATAAAQAHIATVERGRIASIGGVVSLIWLAILVLMVWNA